MESVGVEGLDLRCAGPPRDGDVARGAVEAPRAQPARRRNPARLARPGVRGTVLNLACVPRAVA